MTDSIGYYIVTYLGNLVTYLLAAYTEMFGLKKRPNFLFRLMLCLTGLVLLTGAEIAIMLLLREESWRGYFLSVTVHSTVLFVLLLIPTCYEADFRKSVFLACGTIIVRSLSVCEYSILALLARWLFGIAPENMLYDAIFGFLFVIVTIGGWLLLPVRRRISMHTDELSIISTLTLAVLIALCCVLPVLYGQIYFVEDLHPELHLLILLAEATLCLIGLGIQRIITKQYREAMQRELSDRLILESEKRFFEIKENMEIINIKCHDLRHRLREYEELHGALTPEMKELTRAINIYDSRIKSGSEALDVVLSDYLLRASAKGVQLSAVADGTTLGFLQTADLYSLFHNLLGNAMEYVETQPEENRFVRLSVRGVNGFVRIEIENYFAGMLQFSDGLPISTKQGEEHGYGMKSVRRIVQKYRGSMQITTENGMFTVTIVMKQA